MMETGLLLVALLAQNFEQRGFIENQALFYPQSASNDGGRAVSEVLARWETSYKFTPWLKASGAFDARTDSHRQVERAWMLDVNDRSLLRPAFSLRRLSVTLHKGPLTVDVGRQFIHWGKTDILNPTDRFAPKDYLNGVVQSDFLGVSASRLTIGSGSDTVDLVWQPWFTPSRTPLIGQRWTVLPSEAQSLRIQDLGARYPGGSQYGARWNHIASSYEYSVCIFEGFNHLPLINATPSGGVQRYYPALRLYGGAAAVPLPWFTIKSEAAYFTSSTPAMNPYILYVIQLERQVKEWSFVGGYAGEALNRAPRNPLQFDPERGFARSFVGRTSFTIDVNRSLALETAVRDAGSFARFEYSQTFGQHWRATAGFAWIRGDMTDFIGQYRRNSYASLVIRYSF